MFELFRKLIPRTPRYVDETKLSPSHESLTLFLPMVEHNLSTAEHCGDIERIHIYKFDAIGTTFFVASPDKTVVLGYYQLLGNEVLGAYVDPKIRGQNLTTMFFMFLLRNQGMTKIVIGDDHSVSMMELLKKVYRQFRRVYWSNGEQQIFYDPLTVSKFYGEQKTGWKLVLESTEQTADHWRSSPKYFDPYNKQTWYHSDIWHDPTPVIYEGVVLFGPDPL